MGRSIRVTQVPTVTEQGTRRGSSVRTVRWGTTVLRAPPYPQSVLRKFASVL